MADFDPAGVRNLMRRFERMPRAVIEAGAQRAMTEAQGMADKMRRIAPRDADPNNGEQVRDRIRAEKGTRGPASAVVISDAKDAKGRPKATRVELGHKAPDGTQVAPQPSFYPVVRAERRGVKRRLAADIRKAIRREAGLS